VVVPDRQHQSLSSSTGSGGQAPTQPNDHPEVVIALSDAMERGDFDQATEIVRDNWAPLLRSDYSEVQTALERLPVAELRNSGWGGRRAAPSAVKEAAGLTSPAPPPFGVERGR
jgi:hypothetical protein